MAGVCALAAFRASLAGIAWGAGAREQEAFADEELVRMESSAGEVRRAMTGARQQRDVIRTQCLGAKLTALEVALRRARDERGTLRRASLREDQDAIAASAAALNALDRRARELRDEARQCVGEEAAFVSESKVEVTVDAPAMRAPMSADESFTSAGAIAGRNQLDQAIANADVAPSPASPPPAPISTPTPAPPAQPASVPFAPGPAPAGSPYATEATHEASMLAYSADLTLAVYQVDRSLDAVEQVATDTGGYLAQRSDAQVQIRVPRPRFLEALGRVEKLGDVLHRNVSAEDVTDEFVDLGLRLKNARETRDRLAELLKQATVKDAVEIEKELAKVTEVIEQIEGRLKVIRDRVGFSTIAVSLQATAPATVRTSAILPFAWLDTMGLAPLLSVPKGGR
jgi:hypothetical protein